MPILDTLWEHLLLSRPLLLIAPDPSILSTTILVLQSLIAPMEPRLDFRPLLSVYDPDFAVFAALASSSSSLSSSSSSSSSLLPYSVLNSINSIQSAISSSSSSSTATTTAPLLLAATTDPLVAESLAEKVSILALGGTPALTVEYTGQAALKRMLGEARAGGATVFVQVDMLREEAWNIAFRRDVQAAMSVTHCRFGMIIERRSSSYQAL